MNLCNTKKLVYFISVVLCIAAILVTAKLIKQNSPKEFSAQEKQLLTCLNGNWYSERYNEKMSVLVRNFDVIVTSNNNSSIYTAESIILDKKFIKLTYKDGSHKNFHIIDKSTISINETAGGNQIGASESTKWKKYE